MFHMLLGENTTNHVVGKLYLNLGILYVTQGRSKDAIQQLKLSVTSYRKICGRETDNEDIAGSLLFLGNVYAESEMLEEANLYWFVLSTTCTDNSSHSFCGVIKKAETAFRSDLYPCSVFFLVCSGNRGLVFVKFGILKPKWMRRCGQMGYTFRLRMQKLYNS